MRETSIRGRRNARLVIFAVLALGLAASAAPKKLSLGLWGGMTRIHPSDLNGFLGDFGLWLMATGQSPVPSSLKTLDWSTEFGATVSFLIGDRVSLTAGLGRAGSARLANNIEAGPYTYERDDRIRSTILSLGPAYALPLTAGLTLLPRISVDGLWTAFSDAGAVLSSWPDSPLQTEREWQARVRSFALGWSLGLGLDITLSARTALSFDLGWRSAKPTGFRGSFSETDFGATTETTSFRLFRYEDFEDWMPAAYQNLNLPGAAGWGIVRNLGDAVLDLSGFRASAGVKLYF